MNKKQFLNELEKDLKFLKKEDREEILGDYGDHFKIGKKEGRKEIEIAKSLGNPGEIAKEIKDELKGVMTVGGILNDTFVVVFRKLKEYVKSSCEGIQEFFNHDVKEFIQEKKSKSKKIEEKSKKEKTKKKSFVSRLLLTLFNILVGIWIVFAFYLTIGSLLISSWAIILGGLATLAVSVAGLFTELPYVSKDLIPIGIFAGISIISSGVLLSILFWQIGKIFSKLISKYMKFNKKIMGRKNE